MFCGNCGFDAKDAKFCPSCGTPIVNANQTAVTNLSPVAHSPKPLFEEKTLWEGKPSNIVEKAMGSVNAVKYVITNQRIMIKTGLIIKKENEVDFKNIKDYKVNQTLGERMQGIGDIMVYSSDVSIPELKLSNVKDPFNVKEILRKAVMEYKQAMGIQQRELF